MLPIGNGRLDEYRLSSIDFDQRLPKRGSMIVSNAIDKIHTSNMDMACIEA